MTYVNHRHIFAIALPMILSNITAPLLGLVDTAVIGHLPYAYYLGGSTVGAMLITFVTWLCGFLRMSTTGLSAHAFGAKDDSEAFLILARGLLVALSIGFILVVLQTWYINLGLFLAGGSEKVQYYASQYAYTRVWGLPAALGNIVIIGWLLGQHQAKKVMWLLIATNLINLVLDVVFVVVFDWKVKGVASATVIAEVTGFLIGLSMILRHLNLSLLRMIKQTIHQLSVILAREKLLSYFHLNKDILIRTLCLELCFVFMTFQGAKLGDDIIAANAILMNFLLLISFGLDGLANAVEVLVGKAKGEKNPEGIKQVVSMSLFWTLIFACLYSLLFLIGEHWLITLISDIPSVVATAKTYYLWIILLPILACWCFLFDGVYVGLMNAKTMRNSMLIATFGCFFPVWALFHTYDNHGLWLAFCCFMTARGVTLAWHYFRVELHVINQQNSKV